MIYLFILFIVFFQKSKMNQPPTNQAAENSTNLKCLIHCLLYTDLCVICIACAAKHRNRTASTFAHSLATDTTICENIFQMIHIGKTQVKCIDDQLISLVLAQGLGFARELLSYHIEDHECYKWQTPKPWLPACNQYKAS